MCDCDQTEDSRLYDEGMALMQRGDYAGAIAIFEQSFELYPHPHTALRLGQCHEALGNRGPAVLAYAAATALGRHAQPPYLAARLLATLGRSALERDQMGELALRLLQTAVERHPGHQPAQTLLAQLRNAAAESDGVDPE